MSSDDPERWGDQRLVEGIRAREPEAIAVVQRYLSREAERWRLRQGNLPDNPTIIAEQARDAAQDKVLSRIDTFKGISSLRAWMKTIFTREVLQLLRRFEDTPLRVQHAGGAKGWSPIASLEQLLNARASPAEPSDPSVAVLALRACLERLTAVEQDAIRTILLAESYEALAPHFAVKPANLRQIRHRGLRKLKDCFLARVPSFA